MFEITRRSRNLLGAAIGINLLLGVGVASGVVPQPLSTASVSSEAVLSPAVEPAPVVPEQAVAQLPVEETTTTTTPTTTPPTTEASRPAPTVAAEPEPEPELEAPAPTPAPVSTAVPRRNPTSFEIFQALQQIQARVPMFQLTEAQARQFGDQVCTAFDQGASFAQVKAGVKAAVSQVPLVSVSDADVDYAVRTAVKLFCPGHESKLS